MTMAKFMPKDLPNKPFVLDGCLRLNGQAFYGSEYSYDALVSEVCFIRKNAARAALQHPFEWLKVRDVMVSYYWSSRDEAETDVIQSLLEHVFPQPPIVHVRKSSIATIFTVIKLRTDEAESRMQTKPLPTPAWVALSAPPSRFPPAHTHVTKQAINHRATHRDEQSPSPPQIFNPQSQLIQTLPTTINHTTGDHFGPDQIPATTTNHHYPQYTFSEHKQEYDGHQFQCPYRCLKDRKHCRKAPVREMNRHLRDRHQKNHGFKVAGVDWDKKVWRGAGAGEKECIGRIVEKDAPDEESDDEERREENGGGSGGGGSDRNEMDVDRDVDGGANVPMNGIR